VHSICLPDQRSNTYNIPHLLIFSGKLANNCFGQYKHMSQSLTQNYTFYKKNCICLNNLKMLFRVNLLMFWNIIKIMFFQFFIIRLRHKLKFSFTFYQIYQLNMVFCVLQYVKTNIYNKDTSLCSIENYNLQTKLIGMIPNSQYRWNSLLNSECQTRTHMAKNKVIIQLYPYKIIWRDIF